MRPRTLGYRWAGLTDACLWTSRGADAAAPCMSRRAAASAALACRLSVPACAIDALRAALPAAPPAAADRAHHARPLRIQSGDVQLRRRARPAGDVPDAIRQRAAKPRPHARDAAAGARDPRRPIVRPAGTRGARRAAGELGLVWDYAPFLWQPISRARDNDPDAPQARYLVIHDTSGPNFGRRPFPENIDEHRSINNLGRFRCGDGWEARACHHQPHRRDAARATS